MKNYYLLSLMLSAFFGFSQIELSKRLEFVPKFDHFEYKIITAQDHGFLIYSLKKEIEEELTEEEMKNKHKVAIQKEEPTEKVWEFIKYNEQFVEEKRIEFTISVDLFYSSVFQDEHKIYFFYQNPLSDKHNDFLVLTIDLQNFSYRTFEGHLPPATSISRFFVTEDRVFLAGWQDKKAFMTLIDLTNGSIKDITLPKDFSVHTFTQAHNGNIFVVLKSEFNKEALEIEYHLWEYSKNGYQEMELVLFSKEEGFFIDNIHIVHQKETGKYLVFGGYNSHKKHSLRGVYSLIIDENTKQREKFHQYDFYDFEHFFDPLQIAKTNTKLPILEKSMAKRDKIDYNFTFHDQLYFSEEGYLLVAEVFFPHLSKDNKAHFKGNLYTHSVLMQFGKDGRLQWDNIFEMGTESMVLTQKNFLKPVYSKNLLDVFCYDNGLLKGGTFEKGQRRMTYKEPIHTQKDYEKILLHWEQNLVHWYDDYYLLSGTQRILDENTQEERNVFFIDCLQKH